MLADSEKSATFASQLRKTTSQGSKIRAFSSAGSEHLPYKQRVGGSNPSTPTPKRKSYEEIRETFFISYLFYTNFLSPFIL